MMIKKRKYLTLFLFLSGLLAFTCTAMADAPENVIIDALHNYPDYFKQNNIISDALRSLSWLCISLLSMFTEFCVDLYEHSLGILALLSENINNFIPHAHELFTVILAVSILIMGVILIVYPKKKPDILLSVFLMVMALALQTVILNPLISPMQSAMRELAMTNSIVDQIVTSHIHDLLYIDKKLPNGLSDLASGTVDIDSLTLNLSDEQIDNIKINETINYKNNRLSEGAKGKDGILGKKLEIYYDKNGTEQMELSDINNGFGWNSEDNNDFFNEFYYRYKIDTLEILLALMAILLVYLFMAAKVVRIIFEIVMGNILAIYYSANFNGPQKVLHIFREILNCFIVLLLTGVLIRMFLLCENMIQGLNLSSLEYGILLLLAAIATIDAPNIIQKIVGIDAGLSSGFGKLFAISQGIQLAGTGLKTAGSIIGAAGKGMGIAGHKLSEMIHKAREATGENSASKDIKTPPDMNKTSENNATKQTDIPPTSGSQTPDAAEFNESQNADVPPDIEDSKATDTSSDSFKPEVDMFAETESDQSHNFDSPRNYNSNFENEKNGTMIERTLGSMDLSSGTQKTNYETYQNMNAEYKDSHVNDPNNVDRISGINSVSTTSMETEPNWNTFLEKGTH